MLSKEEWDELVSGSLVEWSCIAPTLLTHDREQRAEIERLKGDLAKMQTPPQTTEQSCPQCGPGASGDEDGCCATCGSTLCGAWVAALRDSTRVRDARVEKPPDKLILAWSDGFWVPTLGSYSPCGQTFVWWLPMPPAPEVAG